LRIALVTPAPPRSLNGNRNTALRWAGILRRLGHRVQVSLDWDGAPADLMVALHAWRSAAAIAAFDRAVPDRPLVVALTGTDIYRFQASDPAPTLASMRCADRLIGLHDRVAADIPAAFAGKLRVIHQSAAPLRRTAPRTRRFEVVVVGHLRDEKDPLRAALAARLAPASSRLAVTHLGKAHEAAWAAAAEAEMAANPRYRWRGEVAHAEVRRVMARARLMVLSSIMEGGANVISEAVAADLPVIASAIPGSIGLLGDDHPGYYAAGDTAALAQLLARAEREPAFLAALGAAGRRRARLFTRDHETAAWRALLAELGVG